MRSGLVAAIGILLAGIGGTLAIARKQNRRGLGDGTDPHAPEEDEPDWDGGCLVIGRHHRKFSPQGPYRVCLTDNQEKALFDGKRAEQKKIGCGVFACAYTVPGTTRVVKFTRDAEDVAALIKAQKTGVVPKLYELYKLKQGGQTIPERDPNRFSRPQPPTKVDVYALVLERLRTVPSKERDDLNESFWGMSDIAEGYTTGNDYCDGQGECTATQRDVISAIEKLRSIGIKWGDIHAGNIGYDKKGKLKVLDLGLTKTQLQQRVQILEGLLGAKRKIAAAKVV